MNIISCGCKLHVKNYQEDKPIVMWQSSKIASYLKTGIGQLHNIERKWCGQESR